MSVLQGAGELGLELVARVFSGDRADKLQIGERGLSPPAAVVDDGDLYPFVALVKLRDFQQDLRRAQMGVDVGVERQRAPVSFRARQSASDERFDRIAIDVDDADLFSR